MFYKVSNGGTTLTFTNVGSTIVTVSANIGDYILVAGSNYTGASGLKVTGGDIVYDVTSAYADCYARQSVIRATATSVKIDRASRGQILVTKMSN